MGMCIDVQMPVLTGEMVVFSASVKSVCSTGSRRFIYVINTLFSKEINREYVQ